MKLSSLCLKFNLGACLGVRLSAPSLEMRLVGWFGSEAESSMSGSEANFFVWE